MRRYILAALPALLPAMANAMSLEFSATASATSETVEYGSYALPVGPWKDGQVEAVTVEGYVSQQVWKVAAPGTTTMQIVAPLRDQLAGAGYDVSYECADDICGGFDFRFGTKVAPEPEMHVDLGDYRFLSARKAVDGKEEVISLMVSRSARAGFVQMIHVGPESEAPLQVTTSTKSSSADVSVAPVGEMGLALEDAGYVVLEDLSFDTGSSALGRSGFSSLEALAEYLNTAPNRQVALVGHTDAEGSLSGNIALSKRRAGSVLERLVADYGVRRGQLRAEGMGYLSPRASNLTDDGRTLNRRVEAILTSISE